MNKLIYGVALALVVGTTGALAQPGSGSCQQHPDAPYCGGDGGTGGGNGGDSASTATAIGVNVNENTATADSSANSNAAAVSGSNSSSTSNSGGNSLGQSVGVSVRGPNVRTTANGGEATATGGNSTGGDAGAVANSEINIRGDDHEYAAASAAAVFAQDCQTSMSGQVEEGGFAVVNPDQFCQHVKAARVALSAYNWEMENAGQECTDIEYGYTTTEGQDVVVETLQEACFNEKALEYLAEYRHHTDAAISLVRATEEVGMIDAFFGYLIRPTAVLAILILLL